MSIRIMHVVEALGVGGGVETGIANLIARMDPDRFEHVLCAVFRVGTQTERYPLDRVALLCLNQTAGRMRMQVSPLKRIIREVKPHVVHSRNWGAMEAVLAARFSGSCVTIHSEHGVEVDPNAEPRRKSWFRRLAFESAHHVFSVSYRLRDALAQKTRFPARRIDVIHNGVDTSRFRADAGMRQTFRASLGLSEEFCIGCVGRLNRIKDYPTILRALEIFSRSCRSGRLFIAGEGSERTPLQEMVDSSPVLKERVRFLGGSNRIPEFLNSMDAYVLPSLCEGISNSLLEAMACGKAVVASDAGGNPEVAGSPNAGLLFPVGDAAALSDRLLSLYRSSEERERLGAAAMRRVAEEFSLHSMVHRYEQMYTALAPERIAPCEWNASFAGGKAE